LPFGLADVPGPVGRKQVADLCRADGASMTWSVSVRTAITWLPGPAENTYVARTCATCSDVGR